MFLKMKKIQILTMIFSVHIGIVVNSFIVTYGSRKLLFANVGIRRQQTLLPQM